MAVDSVTPTIFIIDPAEDDKKGHLRGYIECSEYMTEPSDIAIFGNEYYICDFKGKFGYLIGNISNGSQKTEKPKIFFQLNWLKVLQYYVLTRESRLI